MAHPQHNFTSNFNGSDGHNAELTLNINGVEKKYTPAGNDQTYNVPGVARIDINLDGADLVQAIQTALDGAAQPVLVERSIYDEEYVYQYIGDFDGAWYFGTCTTEKIVTVTVAKEDGAANSEQIPIANGVVIVESDSLNVYSRLRTALALGQLPVLSYVGANPVYAQYEKTADNGDLIFVGALATASDTYVQYNIYTVSDNNTVTVTTRAASAGGGGTPDDENGFFNSSLYQTPGDGVTESLTLNDFRIKQGTSIHGSNIEFVPTHQEGGIDFGEVWLNPGTYILNIRYTLQWVGNPRGTFLPLVCKVGTQPFDFSFEQENTLITSQIRVVTARQKVAISFPFDADTPPMGIWVETLSIAQLASNTHPAVVHNTTLAGSGTAGSPLGVTTDVFGKVKDIPASISQFRNGDVIPVDGPNGPAKMPTSDLQDAILGGPIDAAVQAWLAAHPEATTTVEDGSLTKEKFSDTLKLQAIKDYYTPQMFGAKGDGVTDDYDAVQNCIRSAYVEKKLVFIPSGNYLVSKPILVYGCDDEVVREFATVIVGDSKGASRLIKSSASVLEAPYDKNAVIIYVNKKEATGTGSGIRCYGVNIDNVSIDGNNIADYGIAMPLSTAEGTFRRLSIVNCLDTGLKALSDNYLNLYEQIRVSQCVKCCFDLNSGIQTSDNIINCYADGSKVGYRIGGVYMQITNCCADNISDIVCDVSGSSCVITGFGSESSAKVMFKGGQYTCATIVNPITWGNFTDADAVAIQCGTGAQMHLVGGKVSYDSLSQDRVAPGYLYTLGYGSSLIIDGTQHSKYTKNPTSGGGGSKCVYSSVDGDIYQRDKDLNYIGYDTRPGNGYIDYKCSSPERVGNAIYIGLGDTPSNTASGVDLSSYWHSVLGDILLSRNPKNIGGIGWIDGKQHNPSDSWSSGEFFKIPIIHSGNTASRPTKCVAGQQYYDTTLRTPIFHNGNKWDSLTKSVRLTTTCNSAGVLDTGLPETSVILAVIYSTRTGWRYSWYYSNGSWKIKVEDISSGTAGSGEFTYTVCYIEAKYFMSDTDLNPA